MLLDDELPVDVEFLVDEDLYLCFQPQTILETIDDEKQEICVGTLLSLSLDDDSTSCVSNAEGWFSSPNGRILPILEPAYTAIGDTKYC
eukprot:scaffold1579_cov102-Skeletonema_dohrnii-CCMP3373.AAC.2